MKRIVALLLIPTIMALLLMTSCGGTVVAVTNISNVPTKATAGTGLLLTGTVEPSDATNTVIVWSVTDAGTTGATIETATITKTSSSSSDSSSSDSSSSASDSSGSSSSISASSAAEILTHTYTLNATSMGTVTVTATIKNGQAQGTDYTQDFVLTIDETSVPVPVTSISNVPDTAVTGTPLVLSGTVEPNDATNQAIVWSIVDAGTTGATISGTNTLNTTSAGDVAIRATIIYGLDIEVDYTQDFSIKVGAATTPVESMTIAATLSMNIGESKLLPPTIKPSSATNKNVTWSCSNPEIVTVKEGLLTAVSAGIATVTATSEDGGFISSCEVSVQPSAK